MVAREPSGARSFDAERYLRDAEVPDAFPDLAAERAALLDALILPGDSPTLARLREACEGWRRDYAVQYTKTHTTLAAVRRDIAHLIEELEPAAKALEELNRVRSLGPPVAVEALKLLRDLRQARTCPLQPGAVDIRLQTEPRCACGFSLAERPSRAVVHRIAGEITRALRLKAQGQYPDGVPA